MENAMRLLERFAKTANKASLGPQDLIWFCQLCIYIHEQALGITGPQMRDYLNRSGFSADVALRLGVQYEHYGDLLQRGRIGLDPGSKP